MKVAIIGTTAWGTTLGIMLARRGIDVALWARTNEEARGLDEARENTARLRGIPFPELLSPTSSIEEALGGAALVILAVPSQQMRQNVRLMKGHIDEGVPTTAAALKLARELGVEIPITERIYQVLFEGLDPAQAMAQLIGGQRF